MSAITVEECRAFRDIVLNMPAHYMKKYGNKGISVQDVISSGQAYNKISPRTRDKYWQWIKSFFTWCMDEVYIRENPVRTIKVQPVKATPEDRDRGTASILLFTAIHRPQIKSPEA